MNVGIVGLGLIGGSMAKSIKVRTAHTVWGIDLDAETMTLSRLSGAIDGALTAENLPLCDLVLVAIRPAAAIRLDEAVLDMNLGDVGRLDRERRHRPFIGIDHVAEVEQGMQARVVDTVEQLRNFAALEFFMLLEVKEQVVQVGLPGHIAKVMFNLRQHP